MCGRFNMISEDDAEEMHRIVAEINRRYQNTPERAQMRSGEIFPTNVVPGAFTRTRRRDGRLFNEMGLQAL